MSPNPYRETETVGSSAGKNRSKPKRTIFQNRSGCWLVLGLLLVGWISASNTGHVCFVQSYGETAKLNVTLLLVNLAGLVVFCFGVIRCFKSAFLAVGLSLIVSIVGMFFGAGMAMAHVNDAYAQERAAKVLIAFVEDNPDSWPNGWEDLQSHYRETFGRNDHSFEQFQRAVGIDFASSLDELKQTARENETAKFNVIWGRRFWSWQIGDGPNQSLNDYLRSIDKR